MNKKIKIALGITLGLGVFSAGLFSRDIVTGATTDWKTNAINSASADLGSAGYNKKEELKASATDDINATVQSAVSDDLVTQKAELQKMLEDYYNLKLQGLTDSQQFKDLETQIKQIQADIITRYEKEIDAVFAAQAN